MFFCPAIFVNAGGVGTAPLEISGTPILTATEDEAYDGFTASATGGVEPYVFSLVGSWPAGITIDPDTGAVSGTPTEAGTFASLSVRVTDDASETDDLETFTLEVELPSESAYLADISRGNRTGIITISTTATLGQGTINNLIDGGFATNETDALWVNSSQSGREIKYDFGTAKVIDGLRFYGDSTSQGTWSVEGSHDDSAWTQRMAPTANFGANTPFGQYHFTNTTAYRYYRLLQTAGVTTSGPWIVETELRAAIVGLDPVFKSGDRSSLITVTSNVTWASGTAAQLVDGVILQGTFSKFTEGETLREITFDFATGKVVTGFIWLQNLAGFTHGTWLVEGSNNGTDYTELSATAAFGGVRTWANSTAYRYYRLRQTSGTTSGTPQIFEIEFIS